VSIAQLFLGTPYLWGGRTQYGIDCSGFSQILYLMHGITLPRDASQQINQGEEVSFVQETKPGDLAFFHNEEGRIVHVGMVVKPGTIIHASGEVRIDTLDSTGIYNAAQARYTHQLRLIKRYF
jgi:cell wall-associated NlpC family hydrolase